MLLLNIRGPMHTAYPPGGGKWVWDAMVRFCWLTATVLAAPTGAQRGRYYYTHYTVKKRFETTKCKKILPVVIPWRGKERGFAWLQAPNTQHGNMCYFQSEYRLFPRA